jgi:hypothetical protein
MVEAVPLAILAPFVRRVDRETLQAEVSVPAALHERLSDWHFNDCQSIDAEPSHIAPILVRSHAADIGAELTDEQLIARRFETPAWRNEVNEATSSHPLIARRRGYGDAHSPEVVLRGGTDDVFAVKVDNLLHGFQQSDLEDLLYRSGCNYFTKVLIPRNRETQVLQSLGFVKFTRLRYALKFYEDFQKTKARDRVLNTVLVL